MTVRDVQVLDLVEFHRPDAVIIRVPMHCRCVSAVVCRRHTNVPNLRVRALDLEDRVERARGAATTNNPSELSLEMVVLLVYLRQLQGIRAGV